MTEFDQKQERIQALLARRRLDGLLLRRVSSFAWATCGAASYVNTAATYGEASLLITPSARYLIANNIEAPRLEQEEKLTEQGWEFRTAPWYGPAATVGELAQKLKLGADDPYTGATDLSGEMARLRADLTPEEGERFQALAKLCAEAMNDAARAVRPGQSEYEIASLLGAEAERRGVQPIVNLIATDERVFAFRHPLPTDKKLERYAMLVLCGRRWGLVCSITRFVHFGRLPDDLRRKAEAAAYVEMGFADEWQLHHQGGPAGYEPREFVAGPASTDVVSVGQAYAWNPSITGTKSEDTILVGETGNEVLTAIDGWPTLTVAVSGREFARPAILEVG